jgi:hypothetical protein
MCLYHFSNRKHYVECEGRYVLLANTSLLALPSDRLYPRQKKAASICVTDCAFSRFKHPNEEVADPAPWVRIDLEALPCQNR